MQKKKYTVKELSRDLSPSNWPRIAHCQGFLKLFLSTKKERPKPGPDAVRGTRIHSLADKMIRGMKVVGDPEEIIEAQQFVDFCNEFRFQFLRNRTELKEFIEAKLDIIDGVKGICDFGLVAKNKEGTWDIGLADLKTGHRDVFAESEQGTGYLLGLVNHVESMFPKEQLPKIRKLYFFVFQKGNWDRLIIDYQVYSKSVNDMVEKINKTVAIVNDEEEFEVSPGKGCLYCPAATDCPKMSDVIVENGMELDQLYTIGRLPDERKVEVLRMWDQMEHIKEKIKEELYTRLMNGEEIEGVKLVQGKGKRVIVDEPGVINACELLGGDPWKPKSLKGLGELEKILGKKGMDPYCNKIAGSPTLALAESKQAEIETVEFDAIT